MGRFCCSLYALHYPTPVSQEPSDRFSWNLDLKYTLAWSQIDLDRQPYQKRRLASADLSAGTNVSADIALGASLKQFLLASQSSLLSSTPSPATMGHLSTLRLGGSCLNAAKRPCPRALTRRIPSHSTQHTLLPRYGARFASSLQSQQETLEQLPNIDPSLLHITNTTTPKTILPPSELIFGRTFTDHMLSIEWTAAKGWLPPRITPYQNLSLDPATCVFHYAFECFEGMKAYKNPQGQLTLFRPDMNMKRLNKSAARIALPTCDGNKLIELIKQFVSLEERFVPA